MRALLVALISYILGCFTAAYYLVRLRTGEDVRRTGSGNPGARNVLRTRGVSEALLTLGLDAGKGALAVFIASRIWADPFAVGIAFLLVVAGHVWPAQLRFRGGKGAATAVGSMLAISLSASAGCAAAAAVAFAATRNPTGAGLAGLAAAPVMLALTGAGVVLCLLAAAACAIVLAAHHPSFRPAQFAAGDRP